jgi:hypothetical protein
MRVAVPAAAASVRTVIDSSGWVANILVADSTRRSLTVSSFVRGLIRLEGH